MQGDINVAQWLRLLVLWLRHSCLPPPYVPGHRLSSPGADVEPLTAVGGQASMFPKVRLFDPFQSDNSWNVTAQTQSHRTYTQACMHACMHATTYTHAHMHHLLLPLALHRHSTPSMCTGQALLLLLLLIPSLSLPCFGSALHHYYAHAMLCSCCSSPCVLRSPSCVAYCYLRGLQAWADGKSMQYMST
jgi:hypothetical protein